MMTRWVCGLAVAALLVPLPAIAQEFGSDVTCGTVNDMAQPRPSHDFAVDAGRQVGQRLHDAYPDDAQVRARAEAFSDQEARRSMEFAYLFCQLDHGDRQLLDVFVQIVVQRIATPNVGPTVR